MHDTITKTNEESCIIYRALHSFGGSFFSSWTVLLDTICVMYIYSSTYTENHIPVPPLFRGELSDVFDEEPFLRGASSKKVRLNHSQTEINQFSYHRRLVASRPF